jgi:hypothetical protein
LILSCVEWQVSDKQSVANGRELIVELLRSACTGSTTCTSTSIETLLGLRVGDFDGSAFPFGLVELERLSCALNIGKVNVAKTLGLSSSAISDNTCSIDGSIV